MKTTLLPLEGIDVFALWRIIKSGSMSVSIPTVGSFSLDAGELVMDIENPKVWYDLFETMMPAIKKQVSTPKVRRQQFFPFQILDTYKARFLETVRTMPTADLLLTFVDVIRNLADALNRERKTVILYYYGHIIFKMGYGALGFVPTLVGVKHIEVVDYFKMLEFLNDLALETDFFSNSALKSKRTFD